MKMKLIFTSIFSATAFFSLSAGTEITPAEARAIAKEAYIYGFPLVDSYRVQYAYFVDKDNPEYKGPWNEIHSIARVYTPEDKAVQTPNSDTPYSMLGADLRTEPLVITLPVIEKERYFSVQFIDAYTFNFAYLGSRTSGNNGGNFLLAGPNWKGEKPAGIKEVIRSETDLTLGVFRTQLFNPADLDKVKKIQAGYKIQPLSAFLGKPAPESAPPIDFVKPLTPEEQRTSPKFFQVLDFVLHYCPPNPTEKETLARFAKLGIGGTTSFDPDKQSAEIRQAIEAGMADAWKTFGEFTETKVNTGKVTAGELFGTREFLKNNYLYRMAAAVLGIFGNSKEEAMYPMYAVDADGQKLDGSNRYTLHFSTGQLPPVNAFWSLTMYEMPASLLYANSINRYLINSPMLPNLKRDADGGLTIYVQHDSPGADKEPNWLPAPAGPFACAMRLYWPKPEALSGKWKAPPMKKAAGK